MTSDDGPWDSGLQPERTALAWRRFSVALAVVGLGTVRALSDRQDGWMLLATGGIVIATALVMGLQSVARYGASQRALRANHPLPDGVLNVVAAMAVSALGIFAAVRILHN